MVFNKDQFLSAVEAVPSEFSSEAERMEIMNAAAALNQRLKKPAELAAEHTYLQPATIAVIRIGIEMGLFKAWVGHNGGAPLPRSDILKLVNAEPELTRRTLRHLTAISMVVVAEPNVYALTAHAKALAQPPFPSFYGYSHHFVGPIIDMLPDFLADKDYKNPADPTDTVWHYVKGQAFFDYLASHPKEAVDFSVVMDAITSKQPSLTDMYPTDALVKGLKPGRAVFVDVGGGIGFDVKGFSSKHPDLGAGCLVLQETPDVIAKAEVGGAIEAQSHDFFKPNPVKGARAYQLRRVLHDWTDDKALEILAHIAAVMEKGYSRLLIRERALRDDSTDKAEGLSDLLMMMLASAKERTEEMCSELLAQVGLKIIKIWTKAGAMEAVIETELA